MADSNSVVYGINEGGIHNLLEEIDKDLTEKSKAVYGGSRYDAVINAVRKNWIGEDANHFIDDFQKCAEELSSIIRHLANKVEDSIAEEKQKIRIVQNKNIN